MKKSLTKLILPLAFSILSLNSNSQDFLPGKFKGYQERNPVPDYLNVIQLGKYGENYLITEFYDIDSPKDSIFDVVQIRLLKVKGDKIEKSRFPIGYFFYENEDYEHPNCLFDEEMDGLNGNELIVEPPEAYTKIKDLKL